MWTLLCALIFLFTVSLALAWVGAYFVDYVDMNKGRKKLGSSTTHAHAQRTFAPDYLASSLAAKAKYYLRVWLGLPLYIKNSSQYFNTYTPLPFCAGRVVAMFLLLVVAFVLSPSKSLGINIAASVQLCVNRGN